MKPSNGLTPDDSIQTVIDNWTLYCPERLRDCVDETVRLARLGAAVEAICGERIADSGITITPRADMDSVDALTFADQIFKAFYAEKAAEE
jgi:hypothetical protein